MIFLYILIFIICCFVLFFVSSRIIRALSRVVKFLNWKEFIIAFCVMAITASIPNLFVGISSAIHKIPQLSFGDVVGGNVVDLTLVLALAILITKGGISSKSRTVQVSSIFTIITAILPLILILDGKLSRLDGVLLIALFLIYITWFFSKKERFEKNINLRIVHTTKEARSFLKDLGIIFLGIIFLLVAGEGIVRSASFFAELFNLPIVLIGILIVGLGNALPETYFAISAAKRGEGWMILGDLMGAVIVPATLVLGVVALIRPIEISDFSPFVIARFFMILSAIFFFFFVRTGRKITKKEAVFLLSIYILFILVEILTK